MSAIHEISGSPGDVRLKVLFFHGLNGHHQETWTCPGSEKVFWPRWLIDDAPGVGVASVEYDAALSRWKSGAMTIADRAANIASQLAASRSYLDLPLALVGHSLGGNVIKALIRYLSDHQSVDPRFGRLLANIRLVVFLGTPHAGATLQRLLPRVLQRLIRYTPLVDELDADSPVLRDLGQWYRSNMPKGARHVVLVEARALSGTIRVVSPSSSDPGLPDIVPIPIDADHLAICKPGDRNSEIYKLILDAIKEVMTENLPTLLRDPPSVVRDTADRTLRRRKGLDSRLDAHRSSLIEAGEERPFTILLCGPSATEDVSHVAADLRLKIGTLLAKDGFDVVYGQSLGITDSRLGAEENTLGRELDFIGVNCNAVVVIASGASGWSELGLFGWHMASNKAIRDKGVDIVVVADEADVDCRSFISRGPIAYGEAVGRADIVSLATYDPDTILQRMRARRSMYVMDRRGRPKRGVA